MFLKLNSYVYHYIIYSPPTTARQGPEGRVREATKKRRDVQNEKGRTEQIQTDAVCSEYSTLLIYYGRYY